MTWDIVCVTFWFKIVLSILPHYNNALQIQPGTPHYKLLMFVCVPHFVTSYWARARNNLGACKGFEPGNSHTSSKNHTPTPYTSSSYHAYNAPMMKYWLGIVSGQASFAQCTPRTRWLSPLYLNSGIRFPYTWEWQSPSLQFKLLLTILLLVQQALLFSR